MATTRTNIHDIHCIDPVACQDDITDVWGNKITTSLGGIYSIGVPAAAGGYTVNNRNVRPNCGFTTGKVYLIPGTNQENYGAKFDPVRLTKAYDRFSLVAEVRLFRYYAAVPGLSIDFRLEKVKFWLEGYNGQAQDLFAVVPSGAGVNEYNSPYGQKSIIRVDGALNPTILPPAGNEWDGRLRLDLLGRTYVNTQNITNFDITNVGDWYGALYYNLHFYKSC